MILDYQQEVNAFYDWLETNTLSDAAIVLWHALMHTCNRAGWPDEFAVAVSTLSNKTGLKKDAINRARHRLQQTGRIDFSSRPGQQSAVYKIISLCGVLNDATHVSNRAQTASQSASQTATQTASINKDLSSSTSSSSGKPYESFYSAHVRVFGFECNPFQSQELGAYIDQDGMEEAVVVRAIERAARASAGYNFKLITRILDDYFKSKALTLQQAEAIDAAFDAQKARRADEGSSSTGGVPRLTKQQQELEDLRRRSEEARQREHVRSV
ncbi:DnaD domain protein [Paenibacillus whitsoniae]|uniref:DnaD domain protein n=1 Tax=Paenibacillus whitsoniae TaxID=2496558 RepID=A0A3S0A0Z5_9BACL|nr:DnaD domain protein [Paenibacillus whitsoniae]RTE05510.1 DnaD domain protein [Paenibacillus whitsoniae]